MNFKHNVTGTQIMTSGLNFSFPIFWLHFCCAGFISGKLLPWGGKTVSTILHLTLFWVQSQLKRSLFPWLVVKANLAKLPPLNQSLWPGSGIPTLGWSWSHVKLLMEGRYPFAAHGLKTGRISNRIPEWGYQKKGKWVYVGQPKSHRKPPQYNKIICIS